MIDLKQLIKELETLTGNTYEVTESNSDRYGYDVKMTERGKVSYTGLKTKTLEGVKEYFRNEIRGSKLLDF